MKYTKKIVSLIMCAALIFTALLCGTATAFAATITVSSYADIQQAIASGSLDGATVSLSCDITAEGDINFENIQDINLALNGHTLALSDYQLKFSEAGEVYILGGATDVIGGTITANNNAVVFSGTSGLMNIGNNVVVSSSNGNAVVNASEGLRLVLMGSVLKAENGYGVLLKSDADSGAQVFLTMDDYSIMSQINANKCVGVYSTAEDSSQAVESTARIAYGAVLTGDKIFDQSTGLLTIKTYKSSSSSAISQGVYSENINSEYEIPLRNNYSILRYKDNYSVFYNYSIGSISNETSFNNALKNGGAYRISSDFTVSTPVSLITDADVIIDGGNHTVNFENEGKYIAVSEGIDYTLTFSDMNIEGNGKGSFFSQSVGNLNDLKSGSVFMYDSTVNNFPSFLSYECKMDCDINLDHTINLSSSEKLIVDLNGKTIAAQSGATPVFNVEGSLVIKDTAGGGKIIADQLVSKAQNAEVKIYGGTFNERVYDYTATDAAVFNTINDDGTDTVQNSSSVLNNTLTKENDDSVPESNLNNLKTLGYQIKQNTSTDKGNDLSTHGLRIVTVANEGLLKAANIKEYGYIVAKYTGSKALQELKFNSLSAYSGNGQKVIPCNGSSNGHSGKYGVYSSSTKYKYIYLAVNGMKDGDKVVARFYIKTTDGKTYYSKYNVYDGILAEYNSSANN